MNIEHLVGMVNDIGDFFAVESDRDEAARSVLNHLKRYWDPRMRIQMVEHYRAGGAGLSDLGRAAISLLALDSKL